MCPTPHSSRYTLPLNPGRAVNFESFRWGLSNLGLNVKVRAFDGILLMVVYVLQYTYHIQILLSEMDEESEPTTVTNKTASRRPSASLSVPGGSSAYPKV